MKKVILTIAIALIGTVAFAQTSEYVSGYTKSNGTYVQGYHRTVANNTVYDNYSTAPNVNPYTGKTGTKHYDNTPSYNSTPSYNTNYSSTPAYTNYNTNYSTNYNYGHTGHRKK